jgi:hypothetical protein
VVTQAAEVAPPVSTVGALTPHTAAEIVKPPPLSKREQDIVNFASETTWRAMLTQTINQAQRRHDHRLAMVEKALADLVLQINTRGGPAVPFRQGMHSIIAAVPDALRAAATIANTDLPPKFEATLLRELRHRADLIDIEFRRQRQVKRVGRAKHLADPAAASRAAKSRERRPPKA